MLVWLPANGDVDCPNPLVVPDVEAPNPVPVLPNMPVLVVVAPKPGLFAPNPLLALLPNPPVLPNPPPKPVPLVAVPPPKRPPAVVVVAVAPNAGLLWPNGDEVAPVPKPPPGRDISMSPSL